MWNVHEVLKKNEKIFKSFGARYLKYILKFEILKEYFQDFGKLKGGSKVIPGLPLSI